VVPESGEDGRLHRAIEERRTADRRFEIWMRLVVAG